MNNTTKLMLLTAVNFVLVFGMLYWLLDSGVDIIGTTLADNVTNLSFTFDYVVFLVISFLVNFLIVSWPSKKSSTFRDIVNLIESNSPRRKTKRHNRQIV
ncbi:MAG: hypothetical protein HFP77_01245 [Methylococcales symbiont of Iophon sp. n. MRB-2018]|nr:MAG: hypothetical protein HFP77_01245 [Methylococcales symbiont of Iophon sp. n. MRB-2018]KAF3980548.1 MAG: hypothetical protein HFP76_01465 [Methylococcales symbiont of Iophon sp. n. MRB-2018]